jgi:excisionase family DNA binding protein
MSEELYTVERAAARLGLHGKTVLRAIREGRLRATRIGKAYRITRSDLDAFAGIPAAPPAPAPARMTSIVELSDIDAAIQHRLTVALQGSLISPHSRGEPFHLDTAYDPERRTLKVVAIGALGDVTALMQTLTAIVQALR